MKEGIISPSKLEKFSECPFIYFMQYGLKLREAEDDDTATRDAGNLIHGVLEQLFKTYSGKLPAREEIEALIHLEIKRQKLDLQAEFYIDEMCFITSELLELLSRSSFKIGKLEAGLNTKLDNGISVSGRVDRVDLLQDKAVIIDYKSASSVEFSEKNIEAGGRLQLFLYARALKEHYGIEPAGVVYMPLRGGYKQKSRNSFYAFSGFIIDGYVNLIDNIFASDKKKSPYSGCKIITVQQMQQLADKAGQAAERAAAGIKSGQAHVTPGDDACRFCDYEGICRCAKA